MKRFAVIGLGKFGFYAAKALFEDGNEVVAIDTDRGRVQAIDPWSTEAVVLDATEKETLKALGLKPWMGSLFPPAPRSVPAF
jgi:trk system potassium uptake protein